MKQFECMYQDMNDGTNYIAKFTAETDGDALVKIITKLFQDGYEDEAGVSYDAEGFVMPELEDLLDEFDQMNLDSSNAVYYVKDIANNEVIYSSSNEEEPIKLDWDKEQSRV